MVSGRLKGTRWRREGWGEARKDRKAVFVGLISQEARLVREEARRRRKEGGRDVRGSLRLQAGWERGWDATSSLGGVSR